MSLDATKVKLTKVGKVVIDEDGFVSVSGFDGEGCSCRDLSALAMCYAIEVLTRELNATIERPGGGNCGIG